MKQVQNRIFGIQFSKQNNLYVSSKYIYGTSFQNLSMRNQQPEEYSRMQTQIENSLENILRKTRKNRLKSFGRPWI